MVLYEGSLFYIAVNIFSPCIAIIVTFVVALASMGKTIGFRKFYVNMLLKLFEFGRQRIKNAEKKRIWDSDNEDENSSDSNDDLKNKNGLSTTLIERDENLVLLPDPNDKKAKIGVGSGDFSGNDKFLEGKVLITKNRSFETLKREFHLNDIVHFITCGVEAIIEDEVTKRFHTEELKGWNLLTRTNTYQFISVRLTILWGLGFIFRYCVLFPFRVIMLIIGMTWLTISTAFVGYLSDGPFKRWMNQQVMLTSFRILSRAFTAVITYHSEENKPKRGICVANHTSPIDIVILACDSCFALIGQRHGGFLGIIQRALSRASTHIWFERSEAKDRHAVAKKLRDHINEPLNLPILIFPEGTCINNTSVMMFKKGSFEVGSVIYPAAIKYDPHFGDAFWNSSKYNYMQYLFMMMTSWAIVCDVWYLPPMTQQENESAVDFANRVKAEIARQGGLVDLAWDGQLKRMKAKKEWKEKQQEEYSKTLKVN